MPNASFSLKQGNPLDWGIPPVGKTFLGVNAAGLPVVKQNNGSITVITPSEFVPSAGRVENAAGTTNIIPPTPIYTQVVDVVNAARTVPITLSHDGAEEGYRLTVFVEFPDDPGFTIEIYDEDTDGDLLMEFGPSDGAGVHKLVFDFVFLEATWVLIRANVPAI